MSGIALAVTKEEQDFERRLRRDFLDEAAELIEDAEKNLLKLESQPNDLRVVADVFRTVHTIKGSAGVAGFQQLASFAHIFENLLNLIREQNIAATANAVSVLLEGVDTLRHTVELLKVNQEASPDTAAISAKIEALSSRPAPAGGSPAAVAKGHRSLIDGKDLREPAIPPAKVLIVDDDEDIRDILVDVIGELNCQVTTASTGKEALDLWTATPDFDLIITDRHMPVMDGTAFIQGVRETGSDVPVIFVSGATDRGDAVRLLNLGINAFFDKPFDTRALQTSARQALRLSEYRRAMLELSRETIRSYLTFRKIISLIEGQAQGPSDPSIQRFSAFLRVMGMLVKRVVDAGNPTSKSA